MFICMAVGYAVCAFHMQIYLSVIVDGTSLLQDKMLSLFSLFAQTLLQKGGGGVVGGGIKKKYGGIVSNIYVL